MTEYIGCLDGGCVFKKPVGMHTNGGCKCLPNIHEYDPNERARLRRWVMSLRDRNKLLEDTLKELIHAVLSDQRTDNQDRVAAEAWKKLDEIL